MSEKYSRGVSIDQYQRRRLPSAGRQHEEELHHHHGSGGQHLNVNPQEIDENEDEDPGDDDEVEDGDVDELDEGVQVSRCSKCLSGFRRFLTFLLSHVGLISLVVGYCIMGAFTFEALEKNHELMIKRNMSNVREAVSKYLWDMTKDADILIPDVWHHNATLRLQEFESELLRAMKKNGWNGNEAEDSAQWTFAGALFYSIVVITTIGYGHLTPRTVPGKIITIFYAILGIPLMLLCLSHIGDFLANAFRFLYWKVCCYMCTRKPKRKARPPPPYFNRGRSIRAGASLRHSGWSARGGSNPHGMPRRSIRRSARISQRSADSAMSAESATMSAASDPVFRRVRSDEDLFRSGGGHSGRGGRHTAGPPNFSSTTLPRQFSKQASAKPNRSRSTEPPFIQPNNLRNMPPILFNKYAEEALPQEPITKESDIRRGRMGSDKFKPASDQYIVEEYWEEDDEYYSDEPEPGRKRPVPIWLCVFLVLSYIIFGAFLFSGWENWNFLDSAYFCFITLTTIGFGDFVPAQKQRHDREPEISIALCSLYLLFGISLLAMSFNLVQEEVISNVKQLAMKLGIIREEEQ